MPTASGTEIALVVRSLGPAASRALSTPGRALRVHSVFPSSLNLEVEGSAWFLLLGGEGSAGYPHALVLDRASAPRDWPLAVGDLGRYEAGALRFAGSCGPVTLNLSRARHLPKRDLPSDINPGPARSLCAQELIRFQTASGCELGLESLRRPGSNPSALGRRLDAAASALLEAAADFLLEAAAGFEGGAGAGRALGEGPLRAAVRDLIGLGPGLTPSGDDFLCGFLAAIRSSRGGVVRAGEGGLDTALCRAIAGQLGRTGAVSASLLRCALADFWPEALVELARSLAEGGEFEALRALDALCALGHSSGADMATGFLSGLDALGSPAAAGARSLSESGHGLCRVLVS